jgi:toxin ParE1/3/4
MKVVFSGPALAELDEILSYIDARSPAGAAHVERRIRHALEHLEDQPEAARQVEQRPAVRRLPLARYPYVIYYTIEAERVVVLRLLHGVRRQPWSE